MMKLMGRWPHRWACMLSPQSTFRETRAQATVYIHRACSISCIVIQQGILYSRVCCISCIMLDHNIPLLAVQRRRAGLNRKSEDAMTDVWGLGGSVPESKPVFFSVCLCSPSAYVRYSLQVSDTTPSSPHQAHHTKLSAGRSLTQCALRLIRVGPDPGLFKLLLCLALCFEGAVHRPDGAVPLVVWTRPARIDIGAI